MIHYNQRNVMVRDSELSDIDAMHDRMRAEEIAEVWASYHMTPREALEASYKSSLVRLTFLYKGEVAGMFGIRVDNLLAKDAVVWLLTTDLIHKMRIRFLKLSKYFIGYFLRLYPLIHNFVDDRNTACIRWLKWCGAFVSTPTRFGVDGLPFRYFMFEGEK